MDSQELSSWLAYDQVDGIEDAYWIGGMIASVIANSMSSSTRRFDPADFIPRRRPKPKILSGDAGRSFFRGVSQAQEKKQSPPSAG
jgi:hypothetical protein